MKAIVIKHKSSFAPSPKFINVQLEDANERLRSVTSAIKRGISLRACSVLACLVAAYFAALQTYGNLIAPYEDFWPADYKLISFLLVMPPAALLLTRSVSSKLSAIPRASALFTLFIAEILFVSVISFDHYRGMQTFSETDFRPLVWAGVWLVLPFVVVEAPAAISRALSTGSARLSSITLATPLSMAYLANGLSVFCAERSSQMDPSEGVSVLGDLDRLLEMGRTQGFGSIVLTAREDEADLVEDIVDQLIPLATDIYLYTVSENGAQDSAYQDYSWQRPRLISRRPVSRTGSMLKGAEDLCLGAVLLLVFGPLMMFIALAICLDSPGPVFFKQKRHGFRHSEIEVFKFRTMREEKLDYACAQQTQRDDPRITPIGRFLRKSSLDELPQLLNVVRGEMSLVGPRPHAVNMRTAQKLSDEIVPAYAHRHCVKPGITGWAQINGHRGAMNVEEQLVDRVKFDMEYINRCSVLFDFYILVRTIFHLSDTKNAF